jgi:AraC-like DNA-binding protein
LNESDIYREWAPPAPWRGAVACCWEQHVGTDRTQRVLPDGHADLLFLDSGESSVVGLYDCANLAWLPAGTRIRGIRLQPAAVAAALRVPASSLRDRTVAADAVVGSRAARALRDPKRLDSWLRSLEPNQPVQAAIREMSTRPVALVADRIAISERHLRRLFLEHTGLAPKTLQRILRFQTFVQTSDTGAIIAHAAAEAGYADQPHASRETCRLAGIAPTQLAAERRHSSQGHGRRNARDEDQS